MKTLNELLQWMKWINWVNLVSPMNWMNKLSPNWSRGPSKAPQHTQKRTARRHPDSLHSATHRFTINEIHGLNVLNQMKTLSELLQWINSIQPNRTLLDVICISAQHACMFKTTYFPKPLQQMLFLKEEDRRQGRSLLNLLIYLAGGGAADTAIHCLR